VKRARLLKIYESLHAEFGPRHWWPAAMPFEVMVGAVLTQNTSWTNVEKAILNLKKHRSLAPKALDKISRRKLAGLIRPSGYYNIKAKRLKSFVNFFISQFRGDIAFMRRENLKTLRDKLISVHGIGPETRDSILLYALNKPIFVIDAYTKRIFHRLGMTGKDAAYDELQDIFMTTLPRDVKLYNEYHALIVQLGKDICRKKPKCNLCPVNKLCEKRGLAS